MKSNGCCMLMILDGWDINPSHDGNAEMMTDPNGNPHTARTLNPVPFILVDGSRKNVRLKEGKPADIAPTILEIIGIEKPEQMTGSSLIVP